MTKVVLRFVAFYIIFFAAFHYLSCGALPPYGLKRSALVATLFAATFTWTTRKWIVAR